MTRTFAYLRLFAAGHPTTKFMVPAAPPGLSPVHRAAGGGFRDRPEPEDAGPFAFHDVVLRKLNENEVAAPILRKR